MIKQIICISICLITHSLLTASNVRCIFTSALIKQEYEERKREYLESFSLLQSYDLHPFVIESTNISKSFYDHLTDQIFYTKTNNLLLKNKGVNEVNSIKACIDKLPFSDEDYILKITGRYQLVSQDFVRFIYKNPKYDAFVKWIGNQLWVGCFCMKWKYFKHMLLTIDLDKMERQMINLEQMIADYIKENNLSCCNISRLGVQARIFGEGKNNHIIYNY